MARHDVAGPPAPYEGDSGDEDAHRPHSVQLSSETDRALLKQTQTLPTGADAKDFTRAP